MMNEGIATLVGKSAPRWGGGGLGSQRSKDGGVWMADSEVYCSKVGTRGAGMRMVHG